MKAHKLYWNCPKCGSEVNFGHVLYDLFGEDDNEAMFEADFGVPFYSIKCRNEECHSMWVFGISPMMEENEV